MTLSLLLASATIAAAQRGPGARFGVVAGVLAGLGMATKVTFLPMCLAPLWGMRRMQRLGVYVASALGTFLVAVSPILAQAERAEEWFIKLIVGDGRYGGARGHLFGAIVLLVALIVPAVISGFNQLVQNAPALVDRLSNWLRPLGIKLSTDQLIQKLQENAQQVISSATNVAGTVFGIASSLIGGLFRWATIGLFTFYLVAQGPQFRRALLSRMRPERQARVLFVWEQAIQQTGGYFYSRLLLAVINGSGMYLTLRLTNVPFAAPLAILSGSGASGDSCDTSSSQAKNLTSGRRFCVT